MSGWGVHADHLAEYERMVRGGSFLVMGHGDPIELIEAERVMRQTDATEVNVHRQTSKDASEVDDAPRL